jgi:hypothetical protein
MSEPAPKNEACAKPAGGEVPSLKDDGANSLSPGEAQKPDALTKEEQWAAFEKELKESDWGHQPC